MLATGLGSKADVDLWDLSDPKSAGRASASSPKSPKEIRQVAFSPTHDLLAAGGNDKTLRLWDVSRPEDTRESSASRSRLRRRLWRRSRCAPSGRLLATGGENSPGGALERRIPQEGGRADDPRSSSSRTRSGRSPSLPTGRSLAAGDDNGATCLYDVGTLLKIGNCLQGHYSSIYDNWHRLCGQVHGGRPHASLRRGPGIPSSPGTRSSGVSVATRRRFRGSQDVVCRLEFRNLTDDEWKQIFAFTRFAHDPRATCPRLR